MISDSSVTLVFGDYETQKNRDERLVARALRFATAAIFEHGSQTPLSNTEHVWCAGSVALMVEPGKEKPDQEPVLTWKLWHDAITGLRDFTGAYPGERFMFKIYVPEVVKGEMVPIRVGMGTLGADRVSGGPCSGVYARGFRDRTVDRRAVLGKWSSWGGY